MATADNLKERFWQYVKLGADLPPQTADNMLIAYAYFKQATEGDNTQERPTESSNVVQTFKHDAWLRLEGMPQDEAMEKYIDCIKEFEKDVRA
jgi:diazepam-binding inhibitor (GABA receptor modulating acyl-CoA-binding protein)